MLVLVVLDGAIESGVAHRRNSGGNEGQDDSTGSERSPASGIEHPPKNVATFPREAVVAARGFWREGQNYRVKVHCWLEM